MNFLKAKSKRSKILALITLGIIVILAVLNFLLSIVGHNKSVYVDLTPEGLYTVSDGMKKECEFIDSLAEKNPDQKIKIIFCNDPDKLRENTITRVPYFMSLKLASIFDLIEVEEINVNFNPTAVAKYKATSLTEIGTTIAAVGILIAALIGAAAAILITLAISSIRNHNAPGEEPVPAAEEIAEPEGEEGEEITEAGSEEPEDASDPEAEEEAEPEEPEPNVTSEENVFNMLLIGQDKREGESRQRSDSMMLCSVNMEDNTVRLVSFMRDMYVEIPGHGSNKINAAYVYGGMELLDKTLEHALDKWTEKFFTDHEIKWEPVL